MMRFWIIAFWLIATAAHAQAPGADDTPEPLARVYVCAEMSDDRERLACYDAAVGRLRQAESEGEFAAVDRVRVEEVERESFGFRLPSLARLLPRFGRDDDADASSAARSSASRQQFVVERVITRANGYHAFAMTNGQVWAQVTPERAYNVRSGDNVTIRRAALGSFMLASERGGSAHRVRREE